MLGDALIGSSLKFFGLLSIFMAWCFPACLVGKPRADFSKKYVIVHASTGNGHKVAAQAIAEGLRALGVPAAQVIVKDFCDFGPVHKSYDHSFTQVTQQSPDFFQALYDFGDVPYCGRILNAIHQISHSLTAASGSLFDLTYIDPIIRFLLEENPDIIIATQPTVAALLSQAKCDGWIKQPLVTVVTDIEGHHVWVNKGTDYYWVMNEQTKTSLVARGAPAHLIRVGGIPIRAIFESRKSKKELRKKWGIVNDRLVLLFSHWSAKPDYALRLLKTLEPYGDKVVCFMVCGRNEAMQKALEAQNFSFPVKIFGFVDFMPDLMYASDMLVGKTGGLTVIESMVTEVPLVIANPVFGPEQGNAEFLKRQGVAFSIEQPEEIAMVVTTILANPKLLETKRVRLQKLARPHATKDFINFVNKLV